MGKWESSNWSSDRRRTGRGHLAHRPEEAQMDLETETARACWPQMNAAPRGLPHYLIGKLYSRPVELL